MKFTEMNRQCGAVVCALLLAATSATAVAESCNVYGNTNTTKEIRTEATGQTVTYIAPKPEKMYSGIESVEIDGFSLKIKVGLKSQFVEYSAPEIMRIEVTRYEARPGMAILGNAILLGLPLLFNPKRQLNGLVGCSEERNLESVPDETKQQATGKTIWKPETQSVNFLLTAEGFPSQVQLERTASDQDILSLDLKEQIMASEVLPGSLVIMCVSCTEDAEASTAFPTLRKSYTASSDFRYVKEGELAAVKKRMEQEARQLAEAKAAESRQLAERKALEAREREAKEKAAEKMRVTREIAEREAREQKKRQEAREQLQSL